MIEPEEIDQPTFEQSPYSVARCNFTAGAAPTVNDDSTQGYAPNSIWYKATVPYKLWKCTDNTEGAAVWREIALTESFTISPAGSNGEVQFNNAGAFAADSNLLWDNTNKRLGVGVTPLAAFHTTVARVDTALQVGGAGVTAESYIYTTGNLSLGAASDSFLNIRKTALNQWHAHPNDLMLDTIGKIEIGDPQAFGDKTHIKVHDLASSIWLNNPYGQTIIGDAEDVNNGVTLTVEASGVKIGSNAPVSNSLLSVAQPGNNIEFGHSNSAGYRGTLGAEVGSGKNFLAFHCEAGTTSNTFRTRGVKGSVIKATADGGFIFANTANASADNQSLTEILYIQPDGRIVQGATITNARFQTNALSHSDSMTLGTSPGTFGVASTTGTYGLFVGVSGSGHSWIQSGRIDGTATAYDLCLQASGGNVAIGHNSPSAKFHVISTTEQARFGYDTSNYLKTTVASNGAVTFDAVGSGAKFTFSDKVVARIEKRVRTQSNVATLTPDCDSYDSETLTAQAQNLTIANPSGTATDAQDLIIRARISGAGGFTLTFGAVYQGSTAYGLPAATPASGIVLFLHFVYNADGGTWDLINLQEI